jgi:malonate-semialdehyde dehydrogenase (acetylating)/methylmalonate-semialdehyde dehydrogenase
VVLGCDRGGVYRNRKKADEETSAERKRRKRSGSRLTNCPFEAVGKKDDGLWVLTIKNGTHNHEPLKDITEHPSARRFSESEIVLIKEMTEAGLKPRQILKRLRQSNPELLSTPKHVYNVKAKLRQGNMTGRLLCKYFIIKHSFSFFLSFFPYYNPFHSALNILNVCNQSL